MESGLVVTVEVFCSDVKLRTTNAWIRWSLAKAGLETMGVARLAAARQSLQATVYKNGFEKGLLVSLPVPQVSGPVNAPPPAVQAQRVPLRAFQIRIIEVDQRRTLAVEAASVDSEMSVVVENLEPGMNYTWRILIDAGANSLVSVPVTVKARVCPADMAPNPVRPRAKK